MKQKNHKPKLPKRLCLDPHTQYCKGKYRHRGCCQCFEVNSGTPMYVDWYNGAVAPCQPWNLPGYFEESS